MAAPTLTYSLTNGSTADATQVMQNFNDLLNGISDGTKDLSISALTCAGTATLNGHVNLGNSSADDLTVTASLASSLAIKTNNSYDIGSATLGLRKLYLGNGGAGATCDIVAASHATTREYTIPDCSAAASFVMTEAAQTIAGVKTFSSGITVSGGDVTLSNQIVVNAIRTADQTGPTNSTVTVIFDRDSSAPGFDGRGRYNTSTGVFTAGVAGKYLLSASILLDSIPNGSQAIGAFYLNGSEYIRFFQETVVTGTTRRAMNGVVILDLGASDEITVRVSTDVVGATTILANSAKSSFFSALKVT
jgi:hypothetical protein